MSPLSGSGPAALDSRQHLLLQAASQGNVTLLSMLLNQPDLTTTTTIITSPPPTITSTSTVEDTPLLLDPDYHLNHNQTSALFAAAQNGQTGKLNFFKSHLYIEEGYIWLFFQTF